MSSIPTVAGAGVARGGGASGMRGDEHFNGADSPAQARRMVGVTFGLTAALLALVLCPRVSTNPRVMWAFVGVGGALTAWSLGLWAHARARGQALAIEYAPVKSHWVQAVVQGSIMAYWGWFWRPVYENAPLLLGQLLFVYTLEGLVTWSRGRTWRMGFGPMPIVVSTNLLLWFRDDYFILQFLMLATGLLGKQFITWERNGRRAHIFNPSAFGQSVFAVMLIATSMTTHMTWGEEIAKQFEVPHMLLAIFVMGLVVQYLFHVTLTTVMAVVTLCVVNIAYHQMTGLYFFVNVNIAAPIFLGLHLLITDPATSPTTRLGRAIFGVLYGLGYCVLFRVFDAMVIPLFWDKLLPVPVLNLCVPMIDRLTKSGFAGRINSAWEGALPAKKLNLVHMGVWAVIFGTMLERGFIEAPHPGNSIAFWKKAYAEGKPFAEHSYVLAAGSVAYGNYFPSDPEQVKQVNDVRGPAFNELGYICMTNEKIGTVYKAAEYFAKASELGELHGAANVVIMQLFTQRQRTEGMGAKDLARALDQLEADSVKGDAWGVPSFLVGRAYETGTGREKNPQKAIEFYERCGSLNVYGAKGIARVVLTNEGVEHDLTLVRRVLDEMNLRGDAEACWYLAYMFAEGKSVPANEQTARKMLERACTLGMRDACSAVQGAGLPAFKEPAMAVPGWQTAFPMEPEVRKGG